jgi:ABC-2 type transport system permease protein
VALRDELNLWLRAIVARAYVRVYAANREPSWLLTEAILPLLAMVAYVFIYRSLGAPRIYESMVILGAVMIPFWLTVLWAMAAQLYWEKEQGNLDLYMASPTSPVALLLGMAFGGIVMAGVRATLVLLLGVFLFHVTFAVTSWAALALVFALTLAASYSMGMAAASVYFMVGRAGIKLNLLATEPVFLLGGFFFPVKNLGLALASIACAIPLTVGLDALRQIVLPGGRAMGFLTVRVEAAILAAMTVGFTIAATRLMTAMAAKGKRDGTMTLKWQ